MSEIQRMPGAVGADVPGDIPSAYNVPLEEILPVNPRLWSENRWEETFEASIAIAASPDKVWSVLMDTERYHKWNPTYVSVSSGNGPGARIQTRVVKPDGESFAMTTTVTSMVANRELRQAGGLAGVLTYNHAWLLSPLSNGTLVRQVDVDRGAYLWFWDASWVEPAYQRANEALAARVLSLEE